VFLLACGDYSIGAEGSFKIGANEVALGLTMPRGAVEICRARLAPAHFNRAMMISEIYQPADAVTAGFLDRIVAASDVVAEAQAHATRLAKLNMNAYIGTKLLVREPLHKALRAAIEQDHAAFRVMCKVPD
jgi:enoyl-CoA hydratase